MAKSLIAAYGPATSISGTVYFPPAGGTTNADGTESNWQLTLRVGGTLTNFTCYLINNGATGTGSGNVRKNGANGNGAVSIPGSTAGLFEDLSGSDSLSSGDKLNYAVTQGSGGGSENVTIIGGVFAASANTVSELVCNGGETFPNAGQKSFLSLGGELHQSVTGPTFAQCRVSKAGTLTNLFVNVNANSRSDATTVRSYANGADGNLSVSIGAAATGTFEDTSNSDTFAAGDSGCFTLTTGAGTGSLTVMCVAAAFTSMTSDCLLVHADSSGSDFLQNGVTLYWSFTGTGIDRFSSPSNVDTYSRYPVRYAATLSRAWFQTQNNTYAGASTINIMQNGVATALTFSISGGATGFFEDTSDAVSVASGDLVNFQGVTSGTGVLTEYASGLTISESTGITPLDWNFARERPVHYGKFSLIDSGPSPGRGI